MILAAFDGLENTRGEAKKTLASWKFRKFFTNRGLSTNTGYNMNVIDEQAHTSSREQPSPP